MIVNNVRIFDPSQPESSNEVKALEFEGDKITRIYEEPLENGEGMIEGEGKVLAPSFNDSHMHLLRFGLLKKELDLTEVTSWKEMKELVESHYDELEEYDWVFGKGFNDAKFTDMDRLLTAEDLSEIQVNAYIYFMHQDGHECVISKQAMELLEKEEDFKLEPDEFKEKDENGHWTGRFKDTAVHYIKHHFWGRSVEDAKEALKCAMPYLNENGITSVHTDDINFIGSYDKLWQAYTELELEGELPIDVQLHHYIFNLNDLHEYLEANTKRTNDGTDQVKVGAVKIFLDGTQRLHTAAMRNPYPDAPESHGRLIYDQEQLNEMVKTASQNGMQVAMHAIGDRAVEQAIVALEQEEAHTAQFRHRIIHAQTLAPDLIQRLTKIKPYIETQPSFLLSEWSEKDRWTPKDILPYCDAFESLKKENIPLTLSSDLPIGSINPLESIYAAATRMDLEGRPEGGWMPQERLSVKDSYQGFTTFPAELEYREEEKGRIKAGYQADFVLLDKHPLEVEKEDVHHIQVLQTWHRGKQVYKK
ncbi:amidohydrolase [Halobacillus litoralis]|uniref:amidohydrolase n=1 Tax=Halobacillus litoralis TaxID=45668 RepID=UPI001CD8154D|nr:amidohydrolase [Halobacillus litoralis]MCA0968970.1 amidohydrolase [Halobacillus litoralis]